MWPISVFVYWCFGHSKAPASERDVVWGGAVCSLLGQLSLKKELTGGGFLLCADCTIQKRKSLSDVSRVKKRTCLVKGELSK